MIQVTPEEQYITSKWDHPIELQCKNCHHSFFQIKKEVASVRRGRRKKKTLEFCSRSCKAKHDVKNGTLRTKSRSKPEIMLCDLISKDFTCLTIVINDRRTLPSGLEIDISFPDIKVGIEVNGITHYKPIYGDEKFERRVENDRLKNEEAKELGITLLTVDIHEVKSKDMLEYLTKFYHRKVKPLLKAPPAN